tara:strand:+ start:1636 stop:2796 length:1161 start_codon:yes stop_codon:yes gene_type:complete
MSDPFANLQSSYGNIDAEARGKANAVADQLKKTRQKFKEGKDVEEGFSGVKVLATGKKIIGAAKNNLGKYAKQELKKGFEQFKDKWSEELKNKVEGYTKPTNPRDLDPWSNDATNTGTASEEAGAEAASEGSGDAEEFASILAKGERRLNEGEDVFRSGYDPEEETGAENLANGAGKLLRSSDIESTISTGAAEEPVLADMLVKQATSLGDKLGVARDITHPEYENVMDNTGLAKALPEDNLANGEFGTPETAGLTQSELARATELDNKITPPPSEEAGLAEKQATEDSLKAGEKEVQEKADKAIADKLAEKVAVKGTEDETAEITSEEAIGGFLDDTGILAPIGLLMGAIGGITAMEDRKKKMPTFTAQQLVQNNAGSSYQVGIN